MRKHVLCAAAGLMLSLAATAAVAAPAEDPAVKAAAVSKAVATPAGASAFKTTVAPGKGRGMTLEQARAKAKERLDMLNKLKTEEEWQAHKDQQRKMRLTKKRGGRGAKQMEPAAGGHVPAKAKTQ